LAVVVAVAAVFGASAHYPYQSKILEEQVMSGLLRNQKTLVARLAMFVALLALITSLGACNKQENTGPEKASQKTFASPEDAGAALLDAAKSGDQATLLAIFGPDTKEVLFSGDPVKDKDAFQDFVTRYTQMHRWHQIKAGGQMLSAGADNWVFPIPLGQNPSGQWYFDTAAGRDEILARRIGKGELTAMVACTAIAQAEDEYFSQTHDGDKVKQYAQKLISDEGKRNGLYYPVAAGQAPSPLEYVRDFAKAAGYTNAGDKPQPFDGYYFRILTKQGDKAEGGAKNYIANGKMTGGFAVVAYPAEYRNSGIMTFIVAKDGVVYQKDLGEKTTDEGASMTDYNPGDGWSPVV
jgi:hypothetical protein